MFAKSFLLFTALVAGPLALAVDPPTLGYVNLLAPPGSYAQAKSNEGGLWGGCDTQWDFAFNGTTYKEEAFELRLYGTDHLDCKGTPTKTMNCVIGATATLAPTQNAHFKIITAAPFVTTVISGQAGPAYATCS